MRLLPAENSSPQLFYALAYLFFIIDIQLWLSPIALIGNAVKRHAQINFYYFQGEAKEGFLDRQKEAFIYSSL